MVRLRWNNVPQLSDAVITVDGVTYSLAVHLSDREDPEIGVLAGEWFARATWPDGLTLVSACPTRLVGKLRLLAALVDIEGVRTTTYSADGAIWKVHKGIGYWDIGGQFIVGS